MLAIKIIAAKKIHFKFERIERVLSLRLSGEDEALYRM